MFLSFHALLKPMVTILRRGTESPLKTDRLAQTWRANGGRTEDWAIEGPADKMEHHNSLEDNE
jgi:hypothetical protein